MAHKINRLLGLCLVFIGTASGARPHLRAHAASGRGAELYGGRFNPKGTLPHSTGRAQPRTNCGA
jgi:hypothetical protein